MEADLAAGQAGGLVAGVVDASVVVGAEQPAGVDVGAAAPGPRDVVVGVTQARRGLAALGGAACVADTHRHAHGFGVRVPIYKAIGLGYRFHHMSDARIYGDGAKGIDTHMLELTYTFH